MLAAQSLPTPPPDVCRGHKPKTRLIRPQARDTGARGDATAASFVAFVRSLAEAGVIKLHLLLHSMGARVFSNALPTLLPMLRPKGVVTAPTAPCDESASKDTGVQQQIALTTCTFLHPDHEVLDFQR